MNADLVFILVIINVLIAGVALAGLGVIWLTGIPDLLSWTSLRMPLLSAMICATAAELLFKRWDGVTGLASLGVIFPMAAAGLLIIVLIIILERMSGITSPFVLSTACAISTLSLWAFWPVPVARLF